MRFVKQQRSSLAHCGRTIHPGAKMDRSTIVVTQIQLGKRRMIAVRECSLCAALFLQLSQSEFDVLAGAQLIGCVVRAGTEIVARFHPTDCHTIMGIGLRVTNTKIREKRFGSKAFQVEQLFASKLASQCALPSDRGKISRSMGSGKLGFLDRFGGLAFGFDCFDHVVTL